MRPLHEQNFNSTKVPDDILKDMRIEPQKLDRMDCLCRIAFPGGVPVHSVGVTLGAAVNPRGRNAKIDDFIGAFEWLLFPVVTRHISATDRPITAGASC